MTRRPLTLVALATAMLALPATADAAKVRIGGGTLQVADDGSVAVQLTNPNRSRAKGKLTLVSGLTRIGSRSFSIRGHRSARPRVQLSQAALAVLANGGGVSATAYASAKGKGTSHKRVVLTYPGASSGGGGTTGGGGSPGGGGSSGQGWSDGRWQGTWETNNADLAFNVTGNRLYTGPFDAFYIDVPCDSNTDATAMEPIEATIAPDGSFQGSGTYRPSATQSIPWTLSGHVSGQAMSGTLSVDYTSDFHGHCSGSANFTAGWYGAYTLKTAVR